MKARAKILSLFLAASLLCSTGATAHAAASAPLKEGRETGKIGKISLKDYLQSQRKLEAVTRIAEIQEKYLRQGCSISQQERQELEQILAEYYPEASISAYLPAPETRRASLQEGARPNAAVIPSVVDAFPRVYLNLPGQLQETKYYCGPASAYAVLNGLGIAVTQSDLAKTMKTTTDGTGFYNVAPALNSYSGRNGKTFKYETMAGYKLTGKSMTAAQWEKNFVNAAVATLSANRGVIYNCHQVKGSQTYLQGYAGLDGKARSTIWHFVAGEGWDKRNSQTLYCLYYDSNNINLENYHHMRIPFSKMAILCNDRGLIY